MKKILLGTVFLCVVILIAVVVANVSRREKYNIGTEIIYTEQSLVGFYVDRDSNDVQSFISSKVNSFYENNNKPDIATTFYGCTIADEIGFDIDVLECREAMEKGYLNEFDELIEKTDEESERLFAYQTYYYVMFKQSFEIEALDKQVENRIIEKLDVITDNILSRESCDFVTLRYVLEVKSRLRSYIYRDSMELLKIELEDISNMESGFNSKVLDAIKIDQILQLEVFDEDFADKVIGELYCDGGFSCKKGESPDIKTTYQVYALISTCELVNVNKEKVDELKEFLAEINDNCIYKYSEKDTSVDLRSIYYGNGLVAYIYMFENQIVK